MEGGSALPPAQIYEPLVEKGDFGREFDGEDFPEFYINSNPLEPRNFRTFVHSNVNFQCIGLCIV